jgi:uncharacterized protein (TIGR03067 family)
MRTLWVLPLLMLAVPDRQDPTPKDAGLPVDQIIGDWRCINDTGDTVHTFRITRTDSLWSINGQPHPDNGLSADIVLDATKNPATIDFTPKRGGEKILGIWKVEGDKLILAFHGGNQSRPTEFVQSANLHRFRRIK